ncbi:tetrahydrofolate dehydrogenase/cyclohydrolase catalytic domain-containing protein [Patescibacteria group bacterium]
MNNIIYGKPIAERILADVANCLQDFKKPKLLIFVTRDGESESIYIQKKKEVAGQLGVEVKIGDISKKTESEALKEMQKEIDTYQPDGAIVQLPVVSEFGQQRIIDLIPREIDIDMLTTESEALFQQNKSDILPPVVGAIDAILKEIDCTVEHKTVAIVGRGKLVGKPAEVYFKSNGATVRVIEKGDNIKSNTKDAQIVVSGAGEKHIIKGEMIQAESVVIDVGFTQENGRIFGDVEIESVAPKARAVAPVPGGVGPITIAMLFQNLCHALRIKTS